MKKRFIFLILSGLLFIGCDKDKKETVTIEYGSGVDNNGNPFTTVRIGNQWWMAENLHSTLYQNGDTLEYISKEDAATQWNLIPSGAFTFHNDSLFGNLYNFRSIQDARKIAPKGWRVPTDADWIELEKHIGKLPPSKEIQEELFQLQKNIVLFHEHTWGSWCSISDPEIFFTTEQWRIKKSFVDSALVQYQRLASKVKFKFWL